MQPLGPLKPVGNFLLILSIPQLRVQQSLCFRVISGIWDHLYFPLPLSPKLQDERMNFCLFLWCSGRAGGQNVPLQELLNQPLSNKTSSKENELALAQV